MMKQLNLISQFRDFIWNSMSVHLISFYQMHYSVPHDWDQFLGEHTQMSIERQAKCDVHSCSRFVSKWKLFESKILLSFAYHIGVRLLDTTDSQDQEQGLKHPWTYMQCLRRFWCYALCFSNTCGHQFVNQKTLNSVRRCEWNSSFCSMWTISTNDLTSLFGYVAAQRPTPTADTKRGVTSCTERWKWNTNSLFGCWSELILYFFSYLNFGFRMSESLR